MIGYVKYETTIEIVFTLILNIYTFQMYQNKNKTFLFLIINFYSPNINIFSSKILSRLKIIPFEFLNYFVNTFYVLFEALRDAASSRPPVGQPRYCAPQQNQDTQVLNQELKRQGSGGGLAVAGSGPDYGDGKGGSGGEHNQDEMGPIRIRNLEDLIR